MRPEYEKYRPKTKAKKVAINVRLPENMFRELDGFARLEHDSKNALLIEGVARVLEDRKSDTGLLKSRRAQILEELSAIDQLLPPQPQTKLSPNS